METVESIEEIEDNLNTLETYRRSASSRDSDFYQSLIKKGICFILYKRGESVLWGPSRFVGYKNNDMNKHIAHEERDGKVTNPVISSILRKEPYKDGDAEELYQRHCRRLGFEPNAKGPFGKPRKYWVLD